MWLSIDARLDRVEHYNVVSAHTVTAPQFILRDVDGAERAALRLGSAHEPELSLKGAAQEAVIDPERRAGVANGLRPGAKSSVMRMSELGGV
jgi:hypothetical protein